MNINTILLLYYFINDLESRILHTTIYMICILLLIAPLVAVAITVIWQSCQFLFCVTCTIIIPSIEWNVLTLINGIWLLLLLFLLLMLFFFSVLCQLWSSTTLFSPILFFCFSLIRIRIRIVYVSTTSGRRFLIVDIVIQK